MLTFSRHILFVYYKITVKIGVIIVDVMVG